MLINNELTVDHKKLKTWQVAMELVRQVYLTTSKFPKQEMYGITSQMRRAVVSIPSNIAEGCARKGNKEIQQYVHIALGSLAELETLVLLSYDLGFIPEFNQWASKITRLRRLLLGLRNFIKTNSKSLE